MTRFTIKITGRMRMLYELADGYLTGVVSMLRRWLAEHRGLLDVHIETDLEDDEIFHE